MAQVQAAEPQTAQTTRVLRQEEVDLLKRIRMERELPGLYSLRQLLQLRLTRQDIALRRCQQADFPALQARARLYEELLDELFVRTA